MRSPRTVELDLVLARLGQQAGIGGAVKPSSRRFETIEDPACRGRRIDLDAAAFGGERVECGSELLWRHNGYSVAEMAFETGGELAPVDEQGDAAVQSKDREGQRQRDRKSTRLNSSHLVISYAVFCLKKK